LGFVLWTSYGKAGGEAAGGDTLGFGSGGFVAFGDGSGGGSVSNCRVGDGRGGVAAG
jgi:hypothetical protein